MRYDPRFIQPMRDELVRVGFDEILTPQDADRAVARPGTTLLVVNSMCGCAAGKARPGILMALKHKNRPEHLTTVFAGMELEATDQVRSHILGYPPSSPSIALFKDGELVYMMERREIEGRGPEPIAQDLVAAFDKFCSNAAVPTT
ncbi:MAG TPA: BrxA/BrxB family bacilliredoxin [Gemmatimonadales bacterium]